MGKKTKSEKNNIRTNLDILMNLSADIIQRNPRIKALYKNHMIPEESYEEFNRIIREIYGVFPDSPFPVLDLIDIKKKPSELFLRIDLNYSKDEIMFVLEKFVAAKTKEYRKNHTVKIHRKSPQNWVKYLEIWDLKNGDPPWVQTGDTKMPFGIKRENSRPWTYEEIAKYIYPEMKEPDELERAIDKVKKHYRAAYKLILSEKYNPKKQEKRLARYKNKNTDKEILCDRCPVKNTCELLCPNMLEHLVNFKVKQQHLLVRETKQYDINKIAKSKKAPTAEKQFDKFK